MLSCEKIINQLIKQIDTADLNLIELALKESIIKEKKN